MPKDRMTATLGESRLVLPGLVTRGLTERPCQYLLTMLTRV